MSDLAEDSNPLIKLARTLGKTASKLKKELGIEDEAQPQGKTFVRPIIKMRSRTRDQMERPTIALAKAHGISTENKTDDELLREINLKIERRRQESLAKFKQTGK